MIESPDNQDNQLSVNLFFNGETGLNKTITVDHPFEPIVLAGNFQVGSNDERAKKHFYGKIADLNIWNRSLSNAEIMAFTENCSVGHLNKIGKAKLGIRKTQTYPCDYSLVTNVTNVWLILHFFTKIASYKTHICSDTIFVKSCK